MQRCLFEPEPFRRHRRRGRSVARGHPRRDMAGREYPDSVTGRSLLPWMGGEICRGVACCTVIITASCGTRTATAGSSTRGISSSGAVRPGKCIYSDMADDVNEEHELGPEADLDPSLRQLAQEFANRHEGFRPGRLTRGRPAARQNRPGRASERSGLAQRAPARLPTTYRRRAGPASANGGRCVSPEALAKIAGSRSCPGALAGLCLIRWAGPGGLAALLTLPSVGLPPGSSEARQGAGPEDRGGVQHYLVDTLLEISHYSYRYRMARALSSIPA